MIILAETWSKQCKTKVSNKLEMAVALELTASREKISAIILGIKVKE
jgi:hypothetical protein